MRKVQIVFLIILFAALAYLGVVEEGRNRYVVVATIAIFAAVAYGSVLQERAISKAYRPDTSIFSVGAMFRALFTKETFYLVLLMLASAAFVVDRFN